MLIQTSDQALKNAYHSLKSGDKHNARFWAFKAASLDPTLEDAWLVLASVASPRASVAYLRRALAINPESWRAKKGMLWAQQRILPAAPALPVQPVQPKKINPPRTTARVGRKIYAVPLVVLSTLAILILLLTTWIVAVPASDQPDLIIRAILPLANSIFYRDDAVSLVLSAPSDTPQPPSPSISPTSTPTQTPTSTQTPTATPMPTYSPQPTSTPTQAPTQAPPPTQDPPDPPATTTYTVQRGDTLFKIAIRFGVDLQTLIHANQLANPSLIHAGQKLTIPGNFSSLVKEQPAEPAQPAPSSGDTKRILVDISDQQLYAYQSSELVYSFTASTGRNNTTLTGSFRILDKISNAWSYPWGFWMPNWMGVYYVGYDLENGIHALPVLPGGMQIWGDALGTPISYGCVVLSPDDAAALFNWADVGTPVDIQQ